MVVCVLGTLFNLANILVLTHRDMRNPVNMILTGIAVADCLVMFEYIPFTIHMNRLDDNKITFEAKVTSEDRYRLPIILNQHPCASTPWPGASSCSSTPASP